MTDYKIVLTISADDVPPVEDIEEALSDLGDVTVLSIST